MLQCEINPFATGGFHPLFAGRAPGIRPRIAGVVGGPEKAYPLMTAQALGDVLANESLLLRTMNVASNCFHALSPQALAAARRTD